jgi:hypothetical protein
MSQPHDEQPQPSYIQIKLDIRIPHQPGGQPVIIQQGAQAETVPSPAKSSPEAPAAPQEEAKPRSLANNLNRVGGTLLTPQPAPYCNAVKLYGTGPANFGQICASYRGDVDENEDSPTQITLKIYPPLAAIPGDPAAATEPKTVVHNPGADWTVDLIDGALCGGTANPGQNMLVIWRTFPTTEPPPAKHNFLGCCSNTTECLTVGPDLEGAVLHPRLWEIDVIGFCGSNTELFNGRWVLLEQKCSLDRLEWSAGGDGYCSPRIELSGDRCSCGPMDLCLRLGEVQLVYRCKRENWRPLGTNSFTSLVKAAFPEGVEIPTSLEVSPG